MHHRRTRAGALATALAAMLIIPTAIPAPASAVAGDPGRSSAPAAPALPECTGAGSDDFDGAELDTSRWTRVLRPDAGTVLVQDGALRLETIGTGIPAAPLVQQELPEGGWRARTAVTFSPTGTFQQAGLVVHESDTRYARVNLLYGNAGLTLEYVLHRDGTNRNTAGVDTVAAPPLGETIWLELSSREGVITAAYSLDGEDYLPLGRSVTATSLDPSHIGPYAVRGATDSAQIPVDVEWFELLDAEELIACDGDPGPGPDPDPEPGWPDLGEGDPLGAPQALPVFAFQGTVVDPATQHYNPTDEFIFPSVFHAGAHLSEPLGEWYLYYAPHDTPGGISLMYADSLDGPWTQHPGNPLINRNWPGAHNVGHISSPDAFWHEEEGKLFLYYHGDNNVTRYATSDDGVAFEYGGAIITTQMAGPTVSDVSYARVFEHPDPDSEFRYVLLYGEHHDDINSRRIRMAVSTDARTWQLTEKPLVMPGPADGRNIAAPNFWEWNDRYYVTYHSSSGTIFAREVNKQLTEVGAPQVLYVPSQGAPDNRRAASPEIVTADGTTYLFYEAGDRSVHSWVINYATLVPGEEQRPAGDPWQQCSGLGTDDFESSALDPEIWDTRIRSGLDRSVLGDGALQIPSYASSVDGAPLILQEVPEGDWEVTTALRLRAIDNFQQAGLLLYKDDRNYARVTFGTGSNGLTLGFTPRVNNVERNVFGSDSIAVPPGRGETIWLRLAQEDGVLTAAYSMDGRSFSSLGGAVEAASIGGAQLGPFSLQGATAAREATAVFDWFQVSPSTREIEECEGGGDPGEPGEPGGPEEPIGDPELELSISGQIRAGSSFSLNAAGFGAGEQVEVWMHSSPTLLGTLSADGDGRISGRLVIPATAAAGEHRIRVLGTASGVEIWSAAFRVLAAPGRLGSTGAESGIPLSLAAGLMLGGAFLLRRRRSAPFPG